MSDEVLPFEKTRRQLAWDFARSVWGSRADFPDGKQYAWIVVKIARSFDRRALAAAVEDARSRLRLGHGG